MLQFVQLFYDSQATFILKIKNYCVDIKKTLLHGIDNR
jgi:hypothetical protein